MAKMLLVSCGFTPREVDEEFSWKDIELFLAALPAIRNLTNPFGGA